MSSELRHWQGRSKGNDFEEACPDGWEWTRRVGRYENGRDFFRLHWSVRTPKSAAGKHEILVNVIRFHVESPRNKVDPFLNDIKAEIVAALLASDVGRKVIEAGHRFEPGPRSQVKHVRRNKCTEAFRVLLNVRQNKNSNRERIALVHEAVGAAVGAVVQPFVHRLNRHFSAESRA